MRLLSLGFAVSLLLAGCSKPEPAPAAPAPAAEPTVQTPTAGAAPVAAATLPGSQEPAAPAGAVAQAPGPDAGRYGQNLMFAILEPAERARFVTLATAELCPCDGKVNSLDECLQAPDACSLAMSVGGKMLRLIKEKASDAQISDEVQRDVANARKVYTFVLDGRPAKGAASPVVTIVEFSDYECPHCKLMADVLKRLVERHSDKLRIIHKQFPLNSHANAPKASAAALAAGRQGKYWEYHDMVFAAQSELQSAGDPVPLLERWAEQLGLNMQRFRTDMASPQIGAIIAQDRAEGEQASIEATPTLFLNGVKILDARTEEDLVKLVEARLAAGPR
jgi:protein-disulfide isomerase